jgi:DMSO/TMAO reductase YedYZ heme-binding membrane subunit
LGALVGWRRCYPTANNSAGFVFEKEKMTFWTKYIRYFVLTFSLLLALGVFLYVQMTTEAGSLQTIKLTRIYALTAVGYLYLALLISPFYSHFPTFPFRGLLVKSRRAIGNSAFLFALLHASFAFFGQLGGFAGLPFLNSKYLLAITLSFTALLILALMASTSFDFMVNRLGRRWKLIHRLVYLAAIYVLIHALMLGTHFSDLNDLIPQISFVLVALLLILEAVRFDKYLQTRQVTAPQFGISLIVVTVLITASYFYLLLPKTGTTSLGIHAQHQQLAQQQSQSSPNPNNNPALTGDRTKRYSVALTTEGELRPEQDVKLKFGVTEAGNGSPVTLYTINMEKIAHLIIVDDNLQYFDHLHPELVGSNFEITTKFPQNGTYHLYLDFLPTGAIEQQFASVLRLGPETTPPALSMEESSVSTEGDYRVSLHTDQPLSSSSLTLGTQTVKFRVEKTGQPVTTLKPYLGAFGHMVMIKVDSYEYYHVHPTVLTPPKQDENGGPEVSFNPIGIYGPIQPGLYKIFLQLNPDGNLITTDFTVRVN